MSIAKISHERVFYILVCLFIFKVDLTIAKTVTLAKSSFENYRDGTMSLQIECAVRGKDKACELLNTYYVEQIPAYGEYIMYRESFSGKRIMKLFDDLKTLKKTYHANEYPFLRFNLAGVRRRLKNFVFKGHKIWFPENIRNIGEFNTITGPLINKYY